MMKHEFCVSNFSPDKLFFIKTNMYDTSEVFMQSTKNLFPTAFVKTALVAFQVVRLSLDLKFAGSKPAAINRNLHLSSLMLAS